MNPRPVSQENPPGAGAGSRWVVALAEIIMAAAVLYALDALAHRPLGGKGFVLILLAWVGWAPVAVWLRARLNGWQLWLAHLAGPGILLGLVHPLVPKGLTAGEAGFMLGTVATLALGLHCWLVRARREGVRTAGECIRLMLVLGVAVGSMAGFVTDRLIGGVDARWYAQMLGDFVQQMRTGVFPVLVGQGEAAYNGAVHPFRSAPLLFQMSGVLDLLTVRVLTPVALQHLTLVMLALLGAGGMYGFLVALAPGRRWEAAAVAVIYITCPAFLAAAHGVEEFMMYTTVATLPLVAYGLARIDQTEGLAGWRPLAAGLVLVWMGHAATAFFTTVAIGVVLGGRFLFGAPSRAQVWAAVGGALWFAALGCFYFTSMSELHGVEALPVWPAVVQTLGLLAGVVGLVRAAIWNQRWGWALLGLGAGLLFWIQPAWMWAVLVAAALAWLATAWARRSGRLDPIARAPLLTAVCLAGGAAVSTWLAMPYYREFNEPALKLLDRYGAKLPGFFSPRVTDISDFHPGLGGWMLVGMLAWAALAGRRLQAGTQFLAVAILGVSFLPVPGVSRLWVAYFPEAFAALTNFPLNFRLVPPMMALAAGGAFSWLAAQKGGRRRGIAVLLAVVTVWSVVQARFFAEAVAGRTSTRAITADWSRSENAALALYAYDLLPLPRYYSAGRSDPRLESRILDDRRRLVVGPDEIAMAMEKAAAERILLRTSVEPTAPAWLNLHPELTLAPGEHVLVRFDFLEKNYEGFLVLRSEHGYREYRLPESGGFKAFGVPRGRAKVLSLWNSGPTTEHVKLAFQRVGAGAAGEFGDFARITLSRFAPELSPVRLRGLVPYRAEVDLPGPGWLESPRVFIPGYAATVDGAPAVIRASSESLVTIAVPAGRHDVVLEFRGSGLFWAGWWLSAGAWLLLVVTGWRQRSTPVPGSAAVPR